MLTMFRNHCKNVMIGGLSGAAIGSAAGAAAGRIGINQACNIPHITNQECSYIHDNADSAAVQMGAAVGGAVGFGIGAVIYPIYKGVLGWCCKRPARTDQHIQLEELSVDRPRNR